MGHAPAAAFLLTNGKICYRDRVSVRIPDELDEALWDVLEKHHGHQVLDPDYQDSSDDRGSLFIPGEEFMPNFDVIWPRRK